MSEVILQMSSEEGRPDAREPSATRPRQRIQLDRSESSRLYEYTSDIMKKRQPPFVRDYEFLQRLSLLAIENNLAKCKERIQKEANPSTEQLDHLRELLSQYCMSSPYNFSNNSYRNCTADFIEPADYYLSGPTSRRYSRS